MLNRFEEIEQARGMPMRDILIDLFKEHGSQAAVAKKLGVTQSTISYWLLKLGLQKCTTLAPIVVREKEQEQ